VTDAVVTDVSEFVERSEGTTLNPLLPPPLLLLLLVFVTV
jgi:hypothetical protein